MKRSSSFILFIPVLVVVLVLDRVTKILVQTNLTGGSSVGGDSPVVFTFVKNEGAAFGIGQGAQTLFILIAVVIVVVVVGWLLIGKRHGKIEVVSLALIVGGGIGNCIDRIAYGYVIDFIKVTFIDFPVFNVADSCVTVGVVGFLIALICGLQAFSPRAQEDAEALRSVDVDDASVAAKPSEQESETESEDVLASEGNASGRSS
ncbi:MAG: signal peptidase II [Coriobacteriaceae bacterium]|nr:signal peptidase II [Coriobacteriaceae bacterium]